MIGSLGSSSATFDGETLSVSTGLVRRCWRRTPHGLVTVSLKDLRSGKEWCESPPAFACDWSNEKLLHPPGGAKLTNVAARRNDDEGFTSPHLEVVAEVEYPSSNVSVRLVVWAYPGASGLRTQLWIKRGAVSTTAVEGKRSPAILPICAEPGQGARASRIHSHCELRFKFESLTPGRRYRGVIDWSDPERAGRTQSVQITNTDGESVVEAIPPILLPQAVANEPLHGVSFEIPESLRPDGACAIAIRQLAQGTDACVDELRLYEEDERAPDGFRLVARLNSELLRAQLDARAQGGEERRADYVPVDAGTKRRFVAGYYNDTQNRNKPDTPVLREESAENDVVDWASAFFLEDDQGGLAMIKESHKCVNQTGVDTGGFECGLNAGLANTGWGLLNHEIDGARYRWCWASWVILYPAGDAARELAAKAFDHLRFPTEAQRDLWMVVCTWGHGRTPREGRNAAMETEVLEEMRLTADLGIDMLLIDDGWQVSPAAASWQPDGGRGWKPHPETYPQGWARVAELKKALDLRLGLWGVAQHTGVEDLLWNWRHLGMSQVKLDFATMTDHRELDELMTLVRRFMKESGKRCIISWDTTENAARYGYFWAREYGNVHFMNRKPEKPNRVVYVPWLALRDFWQLARYQNLNKWQLTIQNPEVVDREKSDAWMHGAAYCVATALMGIPEFMALPRHYSEAAKREVRALLEIYKRHRHAIFESQVFPIGEEPSNGSWPAFQSWDATTRSGYLTIFRERLNTDPSKDIVLRFLKPKTDLLITDLRTGHERTASVSAHRHVRFEIASPGDFAFLRYETR